VSLLLDALKKAELAKQQNPPATTSEAPPVESAGAPLSVEPPNITRDRLPDITQPLEILSTDLPSARQDATRERTAPPTPKTAPPADIPRSSATIARPDNLDRRSARALFEAKAVDYNPRRPFYWTAGALGGVALLTVAYFAYQLYAPRASFYTGPAGSPPAKPIATAPIPEATPPPKPELPPVASPAVPSVSSSPSLATPTPAPTAVSSLPTRVAGSNAETRSDPIVATPPAAPPAAAAKAPAPRAIQATQKVSPRPTAPAAAEREEGAPIAQGARGPVRVTPTTDRLDAGLERGWVALQAGDLGRAKEEYLRILKSNPIDRDALLGLATIEARTQDLEGAEARYLKVLEIDPRDPYAHAGLAALRGPRDAVQSESKLKNLLAQQPDAAFVHFALGNQYAAQARWADAQASYFRAYSSDPDNADYAFNLAVSLDQLHQPRAALEYYRRALRLSAQRAVGFSQAQVEARIRELAR
jgi:Tfp pilus assembly protein PilF